MLLCLLIGELIVLDASKFTINNKVIDFRQKSKLLSSESSWYFVRTNETFGSAAFVTKGVYRLFLTPDQAAEMTSKGNILRIIPPEEKLTATKKTGAFLAKVHESFQPLPIPGVKFTKLFDTIYQIDTDNLDPILSIPELLELSDAPDIEYTNRWNTGFTQNTNSDVGPTTPGGYAWKKELNEKGITGKGVVVALMDSGLDVNNSFFYDPNYPNFVYDEVNMNHRKVVMYEAFVDERDINVSGHGSHCAGTLAGKSMCGNVMSLYDGVAPDAKIHFIDAGSVNTARVISRYPIVKLGQELAKTGARVMSNSWGTSSANRGYTYLFDMFATYAETLLVFSAGNDGGSMMKVGAPGDSKNVLTVGALAGTWQSGLQYPENRVWTVISGAQEYGATPWAHGADPFSVPVSIDEADSTSTPETGKVYVPTRGTSLCNVNPKPLAAVVTYTPGECSEAVDFPVFIVDSSISAGIEISVRLSHKEGKSAPTMGGYSSTGPSHTNILKPDVVAPGTSILSARSQPIETGRGHSCTIDSLVSKTGTSMATPNVAGAAALVAQYFLDGYYPSGVATSEDGFTAGPLLLRAMIIASADQLEGYSSTPNVVTGHGIVNLANVLTFDTNIRVDRKRVILLDEEKVYKIKVTQPKTSLRVVMTYHDEAYDATSESLVVDLNMYVLLPNGTVVYGNMRPNQMEEHFSTAEKVILSPQDLVEGTYEIHVCSSKGINEISNKKAFFSLVAVGPIDGTVSFEPTTQSVMECPDGTFGVRCQLEPIRLTEEPQRVIIHPNSAVYFRIDPNQTDYDNITLSFVRGGAKTVMKFQFAHDVQRSDQYSYGSFVDSSSLNLLILLKKNGFIGNAKYVSVMATNIGPNTIEADAKIIYDRFSLVTPTPTASKVPQNYFIPMIIGWIMFSITVIGFIVFASVVIWGDRCIRARQNKPVKLKDLPQP